MNDNKLTSFEKKRILLANIFLFILMLLFSIQGFDLTDEGYMLTSYQQIFNNPESVSVCFGLYLTCIVGGIINVLFGWGGWLSFRIINIIMLVTIFDLVYFTFKRHIEHFYIFTIGFAASLMIVAGGLLAFHYYTFSAFLTILFACLYYKGYATGSNKYFFFASFVVILSAFARFPCILNLFFPLAFPLLLWLFDKDKSLLAKRYIYNLIGVVSALLLMFALMFGINHFDLYADSVNKMLTGDTNEVHSFSALLLSYCRAYSLIAAFSALFILFIYLLNRFVKNAKIQITALIIVAVALALVSSSKVVLFSICMPLFIIPLYNDKKNTDLIVLSFLLAMSSLILPIGSAHGVSGMGGYCFFASLPVALSIFSQTKFPESTLNLKRYAFTLALMIFLVHFCYNATYCYRDEGFRLEKTYRIQNSDYATVLTSSQRGEELDAMFKALDSKNIQGDSVICFPSIPAIHYLTNTIPATTHWTKVQPASVFEKQLSDLESKNSLPKAIIEQKKNYSGPYKYYTLLQDFIIKNNYSIIFESDNYIVYKRK